MYFEHKALYRSLSDDVPTDYYTVEIGKAGIVESGERATIIAYGNAVHWAKQAALDSGGNIEVIDLRTLLPLDYDTISTSVRKTSRVLIVHEDTLTGGIGGELSAYISENLFDQLDAPVIRVASMDTPFPFAKALETQFLPVERLKTALEKLLSY